MSDPVETLTVKTSRRRLYGLLALVLLAGLGLFAAYGIEWVELPLDRGYGEEARRNPFYAAELILEKHGLQTETLNGLSTLDALPMSYDTLILASSRQGLSERRVEMLVNWVERGGHLITVATQPFDEKEGRSRDALLDRFGIHRIEIEEDEDGDDEDPLEALKDVEDLEAFGKALQEAMSGELSECPEGEFLARLVPRNKSEPTLSAWVYSHAYLRSKYSEVKVSANSELGPQLLHIKIGEGSVTALTHMGLWRNSSIHCYDHAYLLASLVGDSHKAWFLYNAEVPSLLELFAAKAPRTLMTGALLLFLWIWSCSLRLGPNLHRQKKGSRELMEHLIASADFLWRRKELMPLIGSLRDEILLKASKNSPNFDSMPRQKKFVYLRERTGLPGPRIQEAMESDLPHKGTELVRLVRTLQAMRTAL